MINNLFDMEPSKHWHISSLQDKKANVHYKTIKYKICIHSSFTKAVFHTINAEEKLKRESGRV